MVLQNFHPWGLVVTYTHPHRQRQLPTFEARHFRFEDHQALWRLHQVIKVANWGDYFTHRQQMRRFNWELFGFTSSTAQVECDMFTPCYKSDPGLTVEQRTQQHEQFANSLWTARHYKCLLTALKTSWELSEFFCTSMTELCYIHLVVHAQQGRANIISFSFNWTILC